MTDVAAGLPEGTYQLRIGKSFSKSNKKPEYHTLRYDFKPKSVAKEPEAFIAVSATDDVQIAMSNEGTDSLTMYKGSKKPLKDGKECLLFYDAETGEMRLEKVVSNMNVKQTRSTGIDTEKEWKSQIQNIRASKFGEGRLSPRKESSTHHHHHHHHKHNDHDHGVTMTTTGIPPRQEDEHMSSESDSSDSASDSSSSDGELDDDEGGAQASGTGGGNGSAGGIVERKRNTQSMQYSTDDEFAVALENKLKEQSESNTNPPTTTGPPSAPSLPTNDFSLLTADMDMPDFPPTSTKTTPTRLPTTNGTPMTSSTQATNSNHRSQQSISSSSSSNSASGTIKPVQRPPPTQPHRPPIPPPQPRRLEVNPKILANDLELSESSDED